MVDPQDVMPQKRMSDCHSACVVVQGTHSYKGYCSASYRTGRAKHAVCKKRSEPHRCKYLILKKVSLILKKKKERIGTNLIKWSRCVSESQVLGRLIRSPGSPRRRKGLSKRRQGSGILKEEERTNVFFPLYIPQSQSHKASLPLSLELMITQLTTRFGLCTKDYIAVMYPA